MVSLLRAAVGAPVSLPRGKPSQGSGSSAAQGQWAVRVPGMAQPGVGGHVPRAECQPLTSVI